MLFHRHTKRSKIKTFETIQTYDIISKPQSLIAAMDVIFQKPKS